MSTRSFSRRSLLTRLAAALAAIPALATMGRAEGKSTIPAGSEGDKTLKTFTIPEGRSHTVHWYDSRGRVVQSITYFS